MVNITNNKKEFTAEGPSKSVVSAVSIGTVKYELNALEISETGSKAYVSFTPVTVNDCILEIIESHKITDSGFAYEVSVNGTLVYFRTYEPLVDCTNSVFIRIPEKVFDTSGELKISITCHSGTIRLVSAILHNNNVLEKSGSNPMTMGFFKPKNVCFKDFQKDVEEIEIIKKRFGKPEMFRLMISFDILYMTCSDEQLKEMLSYILRLAKATDVDVYLDYNTWWDGTPDGPDGKGGYFFDVEYNQVVYDNISQEYKLTVPNMWSNTPWYTMNNETLNHVRLERAKIAVDILQRLIVQIYNNDKNAPKVSLFLDNEPTYWADFAYSNSPDSGGDFSLDAHRAAMEKGVSLRENSEMTEEQRLWLLNNLNDYINELSITFKESAEKEYGLIDDNSELYAGRNLSEQIYTHIFLAECYPYFDVHRPQWQYHINKNTKLGIEDCLCGDMRNLDYAIQFGKLAEINAERCCYKDHEFLHKYYASGSEAGLIFNYYPNDFEEIASIGNHGNDIYVDEDYAYPVYSYDVFWDKNKIPGFVEDNNITIRPCRQRWVMEPESVGTGSITLNSGKISQYPNGARVELRGLIKNVNGGVSLYYGNNTNNLQLLQHMPENYNWDGFIQIDVPTDKFDDTNDLLIKIEITCTTFDTDWADINSIWKVRMLAKYKRNAGHVDCKAFTLNEKRELSRLVIYREECKRKLEKNSFLYPQIQELIKAEKYLEAYNRINNLIAEKRTDKFLVKNRGYIRECGLYVKTDKPVFIKIEKMLDSYILSADGDDGSLITVTGKSGLSSMKIEENKWLISDGYQEYCDLQIISSSNKINFTGRFKSWEGNNAIVDTQNLKKTNYQHHICLKLGNKTKMLLKDVTDGKMFKVSKDSVFSGDMVEAEIKNGIVDTIIFTRGKCRGEVLAITPIEFVTATNNPVLTIRTEKDEVRSFEIGRECALKYKNAPKMDILCCGKSSLGLEPGQIVNIRYCPYIQGSRLFRAVIIE